MDLTIQPGPADGVQAVAAALAGLPGVACVESSPAGGGSEEWVRLHTTVLPASLLGPVASLLGGRFATLTDVRIGQPTLEDVFVGRTGRGLR